MMVSKKLNEIYEIQQRKKSSIEQVNEQKFINISYRFNEKFISEVKKRYTEEDFLVEKGTMSKRMKKWFFSKVVWGDFYSITMEFPVNADYTKIHKPIVVSLLETLFPEFDIHLYQKKEHDFGYVLRMVQKENTIKFH